MPFTHTKNGRDIFTSCDRLHANTFKVGRTYNFTTQIRNKPTGRTELHRGNYSKYKDIAKPRYGPGEKTDAELLAYRDAFGTTRYGKQFWPKRSDHPDAIAQHHEWIEENQRHLSTMQELARLTEEKRRLEMRIAMEEEEHSAVTLLQRLNMSKPSLVSRIEPLDEPSTPLPRLYKWKYQTRLKNLGKLLSGTAKSIQKLRRGLELTDFSDNFTLPSIFANFDKFKSEASVDTVKNLTNKHWRYLKRDCRNIKQMLEIKDWNQVRTELIALSNQKGFIYE